MDKKMKSMIFIFCVILAFLLGFLFRGGANMSQSTEGAGRSPAIVSHPAEMTCSMHPQIRQSKHGKCAICGMDLIPVRNDSGSGGECGAAELKLSKAAEKLAEIEMAPVERKLVSSEIRMLGKIGYNEETLSYVNAKFSGRVNSLFVKSLGVSVKKGDPLVELNSGLLSTVTSPITGIVIEKNVTSGDVFERGEKLFTIADLDTVWINIEAYESDLPWLKLGQDVEFTADACPGRKFQGRISLIQPFLNETTRTVNVRLVVDNHEGLLKPGIFVNAVIQSKMGDDVSPPLVIPATAPLLTGKRAVVYVAVPGRDGVYVCREITLGPRAGDYFIVESGLKEGENVVVSGSFKIDSALQIMGKSSMMSTSCGNGTETPRDSGARENKMKNAPPPDDISTAYFNLHKALFTNNLDDALKSAAKLDVRYSSSLGSSKDLKTARENFEKISKLFYRELSCSAENLKKPFYKVFCPMAFDGRGAFWVQENDEVRNPYFGPDMPGCGEVQETIGGKK